MDKLSDEYIKNIVANAIYYVRSLKEMREVMNEEMQDYRDYLISAAPPVSLWVDVQKDLPDYDVPVLWINEDGNMYVESLDKDGNPWLEGDPDWCTSKTTHWQYLPEKP